MISELQGVVFDMDGVVIDSEITHYTAICEAMGPEVSASFEDFLNHCTGRDEIFAMTRMAELSCINIKEGDMARWSIRKGEAYGRLVRQRAVPIPGSIELVTAVAEELPVGLATGSRRHDVESALAVLEEGALQNVFSAIVTSSEVDVPKPNPETYERAVSIMELCPSTCWAIEDSPNGIRSACDAGLKVVGVTGTNTRGELSKAGAKFVVNNLREISLPLLKKWFVES